MTKELIQARLAELRANSEQFKANIHATQGAIQDCEHWLAVIEESEKPDHE